MQHKGGLGAWGGGRKWSLTPMGAAGVTNAWSQVASASSASLTCPSRRYLLTKHMTDKKRGEAFLVTVGVFLLTVELLCLQSNQVLIRGTSHCK